MSTKDCTAQTGTCRLNVSLHLEPVPLPPAPSHRHTQPIKCTFYWGEVTMWCHTIITVGSNKKKNLWTQKKIRNDAHYPPSTISKPTLCFFILNFTNQPLSRITPPREAPSFSSAICSLFMPNFITNFNSCIIKSCVFFRRTLFFPTPWGRDCWCRNHS